MYITRSYTCITMVQYTPFLGRTFTYIYTKNKKKRSAYLKYAYVYYVNTFITEEKIVHVLHIAYGHAHVKMCSVYAAFLMNVYLIIIPGKVLYIPSIIHRTA